MSLSTAEIGAVLSEIRPALLGGWVQKIYQPTDTAITLEVRVPGKTVALHLSIFPGATRLHLLSAHLPNPERPPSFCQLLRAHLLDLMFALALSVRLESPIPGLARELLGVRA